MAADWGGGWTAKQTIVFTLSKGVRPYMEAMRWNQVARWQYIGQQVRRTCAAQHLRRQVFQEQLAHHSKMDLAIHGTHAKSKHPPDGYPL